MDPFIRALLPAAYQQLQALDSILKDVGSSNSGILSRARFALNFSTCRQIREHCRDLDGKLQSILANFHLQLSWQRTTHRTSHLPESPVRAEGDLEPGISHILDLHALPAQQILEAAPLYSRDESQPGSNVLGLGEFQEYYSLSLAVSLATKQNIVSIPACHPGTVGPPKPPKKSPLSTLYRRFQKRQRGQNGPHKSTVVVSKKIFRARLFNLWQSQGYRLFRHLFMAPVISESAESIRCVRTGDLKGLQRLFAKKLAIPAEQTEDDWALIHNAAYYGTAEIVTLLISQGVNFKKAEVGKRRPAHLAKIRALRINATKPEQQRAAAFPNVKKSMAEFGFTPIHLAALDYPESEEKSPPTLDELLDLVNSANNAEIGQDWTSWREMRSRAGRAYSSSPLFLDIIQRFQEAAEDGTKPFLDIINQCDQLQGWTPLHWAAYTGRVNHMQTLVREQADPTLLTEKGRNLIHQAAESGLPGPMQYALQLMDEAIARKGDKKDKERTTDDHGDATIDINLGDYWGERPLHVAAENSADGVVRLLSKGAKRDIQRNDDRAVPLHCAFVAKVSEKKAMVQVLSMDRGAHINMQNDSGRSPLFLFLDSIECVRILLENGANTSISDNRGMTVLHCTAELGDPDVLELLFKHSTYRKGMKTKDGKSIKDVALAHCHYTGKIKELIDQYERYAEPVRERREEGLGAAEQAGFEYFTMIK